MLTGVVGGSVATMTSHRHPGTIKDLGTRDRYSPHPWCARLVRSTVPL